MTPEKLDESIKMLADNVIELSSKVNELGKIVGVTNAINMGMTKKMLGLQKELENMKTEHKQIINLIDAFNGNGGNER